ncbi:tryptophan-rich sensory protein [Luteococcus peritonei]|uniref:Tryptophan-rich sensory protein n=1 Tax=Luteococcus peritonei TaxID=88874 RepID=A0ABW4RXK1_9ACTN
MDKRVGMVTGATGYLGALVVERLLASGWEVRVLVRDADKLDPGLAERVEVVQGDAESADDLARAMRGASVAWFLIHSMGGSGDFARTERSIAHAFAEAARREGLARIVYLGGLHPDTAELSEHLASRVEVGRILMDSGIPTAAIQAGVVLGEGSASFDMLRALTERLPGAGGPRWLRHRIQPIDVRDVVHYLVGAADLPPEDNRTFDVGGPDVLSYAEMMQRYAAVHGLGPRPVVTAPVMTPRLAGQWIGLITPVESSLAAPLVGSMLHDTVVKERDLDQRIGRPAGGLTGFDEAVREAGQGHDPWRFTKTLAVVGAAVTATAALGGIATQPGTLWYRTLRKPAWQPPAAVFAPVWTLLYADIAAVSALHLADRLEGFEDEGATGYSAALAANLVLNAGWSWTFFRQRNLPAATGVALALAVSSADLVRRVGTSRRQRGVVLAPYAAWTGFAAVLTNALRRRNRHR